MFLLRGLNEGMELHVDYWLSKDDLNVGDALFLNVLFENGVEVKSNELLLILKRFDHLFKTLCYEGFYDSLVENCKLEPNFFFDFINLGKDYNDCFFWPKAFSNQDLSEEFMQYFIDTHESWFDAGWSVSSINGVFRNLSRYQKFSIDFAIKNIDHVYMDQLKKNKKIDAAELQDMIDSLEVYMNIA